MKIRLHWKIGDYEDSIDFEGDTKEEIYEDMDNAILSRGLDAEKNGLWTETLS